MGIFKSKFAPLLLVLALFSNTPLLLADPVGELEPNDTKINATQLFRGHSGVGTISSSPDFDMWQIPNVHAYDKLFMLYSAEPQPPSGLDPLLRVTDQTDEELEYNDDGGPAAAAFRDSLIVGLTAKRNGSLFAKLDGFGSSTGTYELFSLLARPNEWANEIEPNDSASTATAISAPVMRGNGSADADFFSFHANFKEKIVIMVDNDPSNRTDVTADPTPLPIRFVSEIDVFGPDGTTIISDTANITAGNSDLIGNAAGAILAPVTGTYFVRIQKAGAFDHPYDLVVLVDGDTPMTGACCSVGTCTLKSNVNCEGYFSGVGTTCTGDDDGDLLVNDCDNCRNVSNALQEDIDFDGVGNACESCSEDPTKLFPGVCGCGTSDLDSDSDGSANCNDLCPSDSKKTAPGVCGCGTSDSDLNKNRVADCLAGPEVKAQLKNILKQLKSVTPSKAKTIKKLLTNLKSKVQLSASQILVTQSGFNLNASLSSFTNAVNKVLRGGGGANAAKTNAQKLANKIIKSIA